MNVTLGECILLERKRQKLTSTALAKKAGIGRSTIWRIERDDKNIELDTLTKVFDALGFTVKFVMTQKTEDNDAKGV